MDDPTSAVEACVRELKALAIAKQHEKGGGVASLLLQQQLRLSDAAGGAPSRAVAPLRRLRRVSCVLCLGGIGLPL